MTKETCVLYGGYHTHMLGKEGTRRGGDGGPKNMLFSHVEKGRQQANKNNSGGHTDMPHEKTKKKTLTPVPMVVKCWPADLLFLLSNLSACECIHCMAAENFESGTNLRKNLPLWADVLQVLVVFCLAFV